MKTYDGVLLGLVPHLHHLHAQLPDPQLDVLLIVQHLADVGLQGGQAGQDPVHLVLGLRFLLRKLRVAFASGLVAN